ncbi:hypothetical protein IMCC3317_15920 [Kordia antarctica]|uniref:Uncharacterized protein n=1 Tax=Kordia antarctica TaxID=1218801 RepID=A0A7L4ZHN2_9FLAO|nr:DUF5763 domain-containing protein [Kordia antarctica]QHI36233.1 hypothetical protein IMCC3317_15920 [Kordia antarctica]
MKYLLIIFLFLVCLKIQAQSVYKTPSGKRYHLSSCRMVENVSSKLVGLDTINSCKLTPCKICKSPPKSQLEKRFNPEDKSVGTSVSVRCKGKTKKGTRCKHKTKLANGYCYQHTKQNSNSARSSQNASSSNKNTAASRCLGKTNAGKRCKRKVKGGGYCYQHD